MAEVMQKTRFTAGPLTFVVRVDRGDAADRARGVVANSTTRRRRLSLAMWLHRAASATKTQRSAQRSRQHPIGREQPLHGR